MQPKHRLLKQIILAPLVFLLFGASSAFAGAGYPYTEFGPNHVDGTKVTFSSGDFYWDISVIGTEVAGAQGHIFWEGHQLYKTDADVYVLSGFFRNSTSAGLSVKIFSAGCYSSETDPQKAIDQILRCEEGEPGFTSDFFTLNLKTHESKPYSFSLDMSKGPRWCSIMQMDIEYWGYRINDDPGTTCRADAGCESGVWRVRGQNDPLNSNPAGIGVYANGHSFTWNSVTKKYDWLPICLAPTGSISGFKYEDIKGDGVTSEDTTKLPGWNISLVQKDGLVTKMTTTDSAGSYRFDQLPAGTYMMGETLKPNWNQTFPTGSGDYNEIVLATGQNIADKNFYNHQNHAPVCTQGTTLTFTPTSPKVGENVSFSFTNVATDNDFGDIIKYIVDFGDGSTPIEVASNVTSATHTYTLAGTYTVSIKAKDAAGLRSAVCKDLLVTVTAIPTKVNIGNLIWNDTNNNGIQDDNTPYTNGAGYVGLFPATDTNCSSTPALAFSNTAVGNYNFEVTANSSYRLKFVAMPLQYYNAKSNQGNDDTIDSDGDDCILINVGTVDDLSFDFGYVEFGKLIVNKKDSLGNSLNGARFSLESTDAGYPLTEFSIISAGSAAVEGLKLGTYVLKEIQAPVGYVLDTNATRNIPFTRGRQQETSDFINTAVPQPVVCGTATMTPVAGTTVGNKGKYDLSVSYTVTGTTQVNKAVFEVTKFDGSKETLECIRGGASTNCQFDDTAKVVKYNEYSVTRAGDYKVNAKVQDNLGNWSP